MTECLQCLGRPAPDDGSMGPICEEHRIKQEQAMAELVGKGIFRVCSHGYHVATRKARRFFDNHGLMASGTFMRCEDHPKVPRSTQ